MKVVLDFLSKKQVYGTVIFTIVAFIIYKLFIVLVDKIIAKSKNELERKKKRTVIELIKNIGKYALILLVIIFILDLNGVKVTSLIASLGVASAVSALALQDTLKDIISGTSIIMDNYYVVGDYVKYKNFTGTVIQLGLRSTKIMDFDGQVYTIANRNIDEIINLSQKTASSLIVIPTAYEEKLEKVEKILNEVVEEIKTWETIDSDKTAYIGITELADSSVNYGIRYYCSPGKVWQYKRDALRLIKSKYDKNNIKIPYNQIEVHNGK